MKKLTANQKVVRDDILRYKKNKLASTLALLGLVFNCLYFMLLYSFNNSYFYTIEIGISVLITLVTLLTIFLSSEGVKGYNKKFSTVLMVIAVIQVVRIFTTPMMASQGKSWFADGEFKNVMAGHYFGMTLTTSMSATILTVYLILSAVCLVASAIIGYVYATRLENFKKQLENGAVSVEAVLKQMDDEDSTGAIKTVSDPVIDEALKETEEEEEAEDEVIAKKEKDEEVH